MVARGGGGERGGRGFGDGGVGMSKITQISRLSRLPVMKNESWKAVQMTRVENNLNSPPPRDTPSLQLLRLQFTLKMT